MRAREIMIPRPVCCTPDDTAMDVATVMRDHDCGCVPIVDEISARLLGVVTDRDLAVRALATGRSGDARVGDFMTVQPRWCAEHDDIRKVERMMVDHQIRRVPIVEENGCCVGIISQADLARAAIDDRRHRTRDCHRGRAHLRAEPAHGCRRSERAGPQRALKSGLCIASAPLSARFQRLPALELR
jgi:CBS domain-containing protein